MNATFLKEVTNDILTSMPRGDDREWETLAAISVWVREAIGGLGFVIRQGIHL